MRDLHEAYTWEVNAAIGENRQDLAWRLADEYLARAMQVMTETHGVRCDRVECGVCCRRAEVPRRSFWRSWWEAVRRH